MCMQVLPLAKQLQACLLRAKARALASSMRRKRYMHKSSDAHIAWAVALADACSKCLTWISVWEGTMLSMQLTYPVIIQLYPS